MENKKIVLMLDLQGTLNKLNDNSAKILINQINCIKTYYHASKAIIFISSHDYTIDNIKSKLDILSKYLTDDITIGKNFYLNGSYDYSNNKIEYIYPLYNIDKLEILEDNYLDEDVAWFGIIDDSINRNYINKFKEKRAMAIFIPSKPNNEEAIKDNIMCYSTDLYGINGVLALLNKFCLQFSKYDYQELFKLQKDSLFYPDSETLNNLYDTQNYSLILRYLKELQLEEHKYTNIAVNLLYRTDIEELNRKQLKELKEILNLLSNYLEKSTLKDVKEKLKKMSNDIKNIC